MTMTDPPAPPEHQTFIMFWTDGSMTSAPNVTGSSFITADGTILRLQEPNGDAMLVNMDKVFRVEIYPQEGFEDDVEGYK